MAALSIIIPVYNVQDYLSHCLDSLYAQVDDTVEVILVNDGSTDDSLNICRRYADSYSNTVIIDKENGGLSDARNVGTKVATGDYIYYLDSDDWLAPNAIKRLFDYALENDCEIVQGGFYYAYNDHLLFDNKYKKPFVLNRHEAMLELIKNDYVKNFAWGKLYRADIVKKHLFPKGKYYEDSYWQHLIIHECKRYGIVPTPLYYYRQRSTGISGEFSLKNLDLLRGYEERLLFILGNYPKCTKKMASMLWHVSFLMTENAKKNNEDLVRKMYQQYWKELNQKYKAIFNSAMHSDVDYCIWQFTPMLLPAFNLFKRIKNRIATYNKYEVVKIDEFAQVG